jgi:hypothetical protein
MIQFFVVFHKIIADECYANVPQEVLDKYFTFIAVNEAIPKKYTSGKYKVVNEWELPLYDGDMQKQGYNENSAVHHVFLNGLHRQYSKIGFFQYDTRFGSDFVNNIPNMITLNDSYCLGLRTTFPSALKFCIQDSWPLGANLPGYIIQDYEAFFNKKFNTDKVYPLWNTWVVPTTVYERIMPWVIQMRTKLYPWAVQPPYDSSPTVIGGIFERIMALAIGDELLYIGMPDLKHDHKIKVLAY